MVKETEIKNVNEFYKGLRNKVANLFNLYDKVEMFKGMTEKQKRTIFEFGCACLSEVYNPIQKRYTKQERKKAELKLKQIRHQVCEEIRKFCRDNFTICLKDAPEQQQAEVLGYNNCLKELREFLNQIEQGEKK